MAYKTQAGKIYGKTLESMKDKKKKEEAAKVMKPKKAVKKAKF